MVYSSAHAQQACDEARLGCEGDAGERAGFEGDVQLGQAGHGAEGYIDRKQGASAAPQGLDALKAQVDALLICDT